MTLQRGGEELKHKHNTRDMRDMQFHLDLRFDTEIHGTRERNLAVWTLYGSRRDIECSPPVAVSDTPCQVISLHKWGRGSLAGY